MPENEFEKQVKQLMEELRFSPSAPVWEKIKKSIGEKKRRILPIFFLFIVAAILGGYFFYNDINFQKQNANKTSATINKTPVTKNLPDNTNTEKNNNSTVETKPQQQSIPKKIKSKKSVLVIKHFKENEIVLNHHLTDKKDIVEVVTNNSDSKNSAGIVSSTKTNGVSNNNITVQQQTDSKHSFSDTSILIKNNTLLINDTNRVKNNADTLIKTINEVVKNNTSADKKNKDSKIKKTGKWQWGISVMYGRSNITDNFINGNREKSSQPSLTNPGGFNANALSDPYYTNDAYNFGVTLQRQISKHNFITSGLNFVHLSSKSNAGRSLDSVLIVVAADFQTGNYASSFYRIGSAKTYINNFNFIELPITFQSNLFHVKNFAVLYDAGVSVMQMVSSKSLLYNNTSNSFYANDDLLRRTQFQLTGGLNLQLSTKNSGRFLLGPHLSYSLSSYQKNSGNNLHFINYGLKATWLFNKK